MAARIDRVVRHPPEGLYLFRFELKGPDGRPLSLTTDAQGHGLYVVRKPKKHETPGDAWRTLCFCAKRTDMLEQTCITADRLAGQQDFSLGQDTSPQEAARLLLDKLTELSWEPVLADNISYLDNPPRVRNKKPVPRRQP